MFPVTKPQQCASAASLTSNVDAETVNTTRFVVRNPDVDHNPPFTVCRVCLAMSVKMYHMSEHKLRVMYERLTGVEVRTDDNLPKMLCWECVARLTSANNLINKALKSYCLLLKNINEGRFVTISDIESIDRTQYQLESSLGFKYYEVNNTDLHIQSESDTIDDSDSSNELLILKYEDSELNQEGENVEIKSELLVTIEQQEADLQVPNPIIVIKEDESDEEVTIDSVSHASEASEEDNPIVDKDGSKGLVHNKELRVVLEDIMLSLRKQNTQYCYNEITNSVSYLKAQSINSEETVTDSTINKGTLTNTNMDTDSRSSSEAAETSFQVHTNNTKKTVRKQTNTPSRHINSKHTKKILNHHVNAIHTKNNVFHCSHCDYKTCNKSNLVRHVNAKHTKNNVFNCSYCEYKSYRSNNLTEHINSKHTKNIIINCPHCSYKAYRSSDLSRHVNIKHSKSKVYNCSYCSYKAYAKSALYHHFKAVHTMNSVFNCSHCNYKTRNKSLLNSHVTAKHTKNVVFNCSYCEYVSYRKSHLTDHVNRKHTKNTVFRCAHCDYKTYTKITLAKHINNKHNRSTAFNCAHCSYKGFDRSNLCKHIKIKHKN